MGLQETKLSEVSDPTISHIFGHQNLQKGLFVVGIALLLLNLLDTAIPSFLLLKVLR